MDLQSKIASAIGVPDGVVLYHWATETHSPVDRNDAKSARSENPVAVEVGKLLDDVRSALDSDLGTAMKAAENLASLLASKLPHDVPPAAARGGLAPWQKRKVQGYIENCLDGPLLIEDLAKLVSLSTSYFCRAFKESFGKPPHAYIISMRVQLARKLMLTTSESLSQIALACGLVDQAHLCRCFRQATGMTPGAWRRRHAIGSVERDHIRPKSPTGLGLA